MKTRSASRSKTLFIFIDESGNFDFSPSGTRYFVMAGVASSDPIEAALELQRVKYEILSSGFDLATFHASQDLDWIKHKVFQAISVTKSIDVHVLFVEKRLVPLDKQLGWKLHGLLTRELIRYSNRLVESDKSNQVIVILDQALSVSQQGAFQVAMRQELKDLGKPFHIFFHPIKSDFIGQIADHVAWAKFRQLERGDDGPWNLLSRTLRPTEQDFFGD